MRFSGGRVAFGRHETFSLRYSWLPKGFQAIKNNPKTFDSDDSTVTLGVGKNMVNSIKYWLLATQCLRKLPDNSLEATEIGSFLLGEEGWDPYLEDEATIWVLHWLISTNPTLASGFFYFFNLFHKPDFKSQELAESLINFGKENIVTRSSENTLKQDMTVLLRMYSSINGKPSGALEESLDSPMSLLKLVQYFSQNKTYQSKPEARSSLHPLIVGFAVVSMLEYTGENTIPLEDIMFSRDGLPAPGSIFRLTESSLVAKLESAISMMPGILEIRESAGIHQVYKVGDSNSLEFLDKYYDQACVGARP